MQKDAFSIVYDEKNIAVNAHLLKKGELVFVISEKHYFTARGENIIFGAGEVLYGIDRNCLEQRGLKVYGKKGAIISNIPNQNLKRYIQLYNIGFNITKFMAECVRKTNQILGEINQKLVMGNNASRRYYKFYYNIISRMRENSRLINHDVIEAFLTEKEDTLAYRKGKAFSNIHQEDATVLGKKLDDFTTEYATGAILCRQNEDANNLYILNQGRIKVLLNEEEIFTIHKAGTIFGEMSLFLNEPRSATLMAAEHSVVTIIRKENLKTIAEKMPDFFKNITSSLWERFKNNIIMIKEFEELNAEKARLDLQILAQELLGLYRSEKINWLITLKEEIGNAL